MPPCGFQHIPERLHWNDKPPIEEFHSGEKLYWRVEKEKKINEPPYNYFRDRTLAEISTNRSGANDELSLPEDVLLCIEGNQTHYIGHWPVIFVVPTMQEIAFSETMGNLSLRIGLIHVPEDCNYSHSVFRFFLNEEVVTYTNYDDTLNVNVAPNKRDAKNLRKAARDYLHKLIVGNQN